MAVKIRTKAGDSFVCTDVSVEDVLQAIREDKEIFCCREWTSLGGGEYEVEVHCVRVSEISSFSSTAPPPDGPDEDEDRRITKDDVIATMRLKLSD